MKLHRSIHATFSVLADGNPSRTALVSDDRIVSYAALEQRAERLARFLQRHGVGRGDRVGLYCQRSVDAVGAMLGILKAGAAYVPFDPSYPHKMLKFVYDDSAPSLMLGQPDLVDEENPAFWDGALHDIESVSESEAGVDEAQELPEMGPDDPAYLMYTSGSTGHPKGVLIPHRGVVRLVIDNPFADMGPTQVHLQLAPLAFDASTFEIWGALLNGGTLAILSLPHPSLDDIATSIARHGITTLWLTAGLFHLMVDHRLDGLKPLKQLIAGGDVLSPQHVARAQSALPACQLINGYGPTENTTFTCCYRIPATGEASTIPIGKPIAHTVVHVLDELRHRVKDGEEGELYAGGAGLALGYWQRPDLTAERFVPDPFSAPGVAKLYRTGDRVRTRKDGNLEFLGRVDRQIKVNGKRVELDEIEACLRRNSEVQDAAVVSPLQTGATRKIYAFLKFKEDKSNNIKGIRDFLKKELPEYMMPATFTELGALPLSATGKVDRARLPLPVSAQTAEWGTGQSPVGTDFETRLLKIWREVLAAGVFGLDDNFFDVGGTSLQVLQIHAKIIDTMKIDVAVVDLFQYPRIRELAAKLQRGSASSPASPGNGAGLTASERARRQQAALARARSNSRRLER